MNGTNGTPAGAAGTGERFKFEAWHKITALAHDEARRRLAQAEEGLAQARATRDARRAEVDLLEKALALRPGPRRPGQPGAGVGHQAAVFLLEVLTTRFRQSGDPAFTTGLAKLAANGWSTTTIKSGLRRLLADGMIERLGPGAYRLTEFGRGQPPAAAGTLPLLPPREPEGVTS
jgi:hypothetical protein